MSKSPLICLAGFLVLMALNTPVSARSPFFAVGGPDAFGYGYIDSDEPGGPTMNWEEIGTTGTISTPAGGSHDTTVAQLGFAFPYYGNTYTQCFLNTNGNLNFVSASDNSSNVTIPSAGVPNGMIAAFWTHIHMNSAGTVRHQSFTSPDRFVAQWTDGFESGSTGSITFQIKLYSTGMIVMNYLTVPAVPWAEGASATVGIENAAGTIGLQYLYNDATSANKLKSGLVIQWGQGVDPNPPTGSVHAATPGGTAQPDNFISDATVFFRGNVTDADATQTVGVQAEILPLTTAFDPVLVTGQVTSSPLVANGTTAEAMYTFTGSPYGNGTYHWRLRGTDMFGRVSTWVTPVNDQFQVDIVEPGLVTLSNPMDGTDVEVSGVDGGNITFAWSPPADAGPAPLGSYDIEIARDNGFANMIASATVTSPTYTTYIPTWHLFYYWRVKARDSVDNAGQFTQEFSFRSVHDNHHDNAAGDPARVCGSAVPSAGGGLAALLAVAAALLIRRIR